MDRADKASATFTSGYNCSEAVLLAFSEELGLDKDAAVKIASGFGGGIGHMAETCGAVTGAVMVIGLKHGLSIKDNVYKSNHVVYAIVEEFIKEFLKRHPSIKCKDLLGVDFHDEAAYKEAVKKGVFYEVCPDFVADAVEILDNMYNKSPRQ